MIGMRAVSSRERQRRQSSMPLRPGQHPVEQDQVGDAVADALDGLVAAFGGDDAEALGLEVVAHQLAEVGFVLDDQDGRRSSRWPIP